MTRPKKHTRGEVRLVFVAFQKQKGRTPTVRELADLLMVSTRTAWRYMEQWCLRVECHHCSGTGYQKSGA